jgi:hypothetical protein
VSNTTTLYDRMLKSAWEAEAKAMLERADLSWRNTCRLRGWHIDALCSLEELHGGTIRRIPVELRPRATSDAIAALGLLYDRHPAMVRELANRWLWETFEIAEMLRSKGATR